MASQSDFETPKPTFCERRHEREVGVLAVLEANHPATPVTGTATDPAMMEQQDLVHDHPVAWLNGSVRSP